MPTTLRSGATYDTLKPPATKRRRTGTKADARTSLTVRGDSSLLTLGAKGVTVGRGAVIAAGSVVANDVKPLCLYGGSPAKLIRELENEIK